jgi:hypothetical protein
VNLVRRCCVAAAVLVAASAATTLAAVAAPAHATRNVSRCVPASQLSAGSRSGAVSVALRGTHGAFTLRVAERAQARDLNYEALATTCSRAMVRRTWYTDIHPKSGGNCHACDSHEYWVDFGHGGWASLGLFSG